MTVFRFGFHNGAIAYMLQISESAKYIIFVAWVVFREAIFLRLKFKPDDRFLPCIYVY